MKRFVPHLRLSSIYEIDLQGLYDEGIHGIITDLDSTLVGAKVADHTPELAAWVREARSIGFVIAIVSNNSEERVARFAKPLDMDYVFAAKKPGRQAFARALEVVKLPAEQVIMLGDQLLTDVFGANNAGIRVILVEPVEPSQEKVKTRINRVLEKIVLFFLRLFRLWKD